MSSNKYDDIDNLFQNKLGNGNLSENSWNTPSDHIFDLALIQVDEEKKKRRKIFIFWWGFGLAILGIAMISFIFLPMNKTLKDDINNGQRAKNYVDGSKSKEEKWANLTDVKIETISHVDKLSEADVKNLGGSKVKDDREFIKQADYHTPTSIIIKDEVAPTLIERNNSEIVIIEPMKSGSIHLSLNSIKKAPPLAIAGIPLSAPEPNIEERLELLSDDIIVVVYVQDSSKVDQSKSMDLNVLSIGLGSNISSMRMINTSNTKALLTEYDNYYPGLNLDISYERQIKPRLSLKTHLGISQIRNNSTFVHEFDYDKSLEVLNTQGLLMFDSEYSIANPLGEITNRLEMYVGDEVMEDGSKMKQETKNSQQLWMVSAGVGIALNLKENENILWSVSSGVAVNHMVSYNGSFEMEISHKDKRMYEESLERKATDQLNKNILSVQLKSKLAFKVSNSLALYAEGATNNYIQSIKQVNPNSPEKTFVNLFNVSFGVQHHF